MEAEERHPPSIRDDGAALAAPLFTEEAEEEARPVVPLGRIGAARPPTNPARRRLPQSLLLVLVFIVAGAFVGAAAGYLSLTRRAHEPAAQATADVTPAPPQPAPGNSSEPSAVAARERPSRVEPQAHGETQRPNPERAEGRVRDEGGRAEHERKEERPRPEGAEASGERRHEESEKIEERQRDEEKHGKPKARLVGTITERPRP